MQINVDDLGIEAISIKFRFSILHYLLIKVPFIIEIMVSLHDSLQQIRCECCFIMDPISVHII